MPCKDLNIHWPWKHFLWAVCKVIPGHQQIILEQGWVSLCRNLTRCEGGGDEVQENHRGDQDPDEAAWHPFCLVSPYLQTPALWIPTLELAPCPDCGCDVSSSQNLHLPAGRGEVTRCPQTSALGHPVGPAHLKDYLCSLPCWSGRPVASVPDLGITAWIAQGCVRRFRVEAPGSQWGFWSWSFCSASVCFSNNMPTCRPLVV